jgi:hypothetical protein
MDIEKRLDQLDRDNKAAHQASGEKIDAHFSELRDALSDLIVLQTTHDMVAKDVEDHEERIESLERFATLVKGGAAVAGVLLTAVISLFVSIIKGHIV